MYATRETVTAFISVCPNNDLELEECGCRGPRGTVDRRWDSDAASIMCSDMFLYCFIMQSDEEHFFLLYYFYFILIFIIYSKAEYFMSSFVLCLLNVTHRTIDDWFILNYFKHFSGNYTFYTVKVNWFKNLI